MRIVNENPPNNLRETIANYGMLPHNGVIYTYGDTIYNPSAISLPDHLIEHEETHCDQQGGAPDTWWGRYLTDPYFRIEQEAEAYGRQYAYICATVKDRNRRNLVLIDLARILAGPVYGSVIGRQSAMEMIRNYAHV